MTQVNDGIVRDIIRDSPAQRKMSSWNDLSVDDGPAKYSSSRQAPQMAPLPPVSSPEGTALQVVRALLDCPVNLLQGALPNKFSRERDKSLSISLSDLPVGGNMLSKFQALLFRRVSWEKEPVAFLVQCFLRSQAAPKAEWAQDVWSGICVCARETTVSLTMEQLVQVADALPSDDLWAQYRSHSAPRAFLECVSGSSLNGVEVPPDMLSQILTCAKTTRPGRSSIANLVRVATERLPEIERVDEVYMEAAKCTTALSNLLENPTCVEVLCDVLRKEVEEALTSNGQYFQERSYLGHALTPSPMFVKSKKDPLGLKRYAAYVAISGFPQLTYSSVMPCHHSVRQGINKCQDLTFSILRKITRVKGAGKTNVLAWLAAVVTLNEKKTGPRYDAAAISKETVSDGFMLNLSTVLLRLMQSLYTIAPTANLAKVDPHYPAAPDCRLPFSNESCLAKGTINCAKKSLMEQFFIADTSFNFMTECFHITQRALHVGLGPAIESMYHFLRSSIPGQPDVERTLHLLIQVGCSAHLLDPAFALPCSQFYITYCVWITMQFEDCKQAVESEEELDSALTAKFCQVPLYPLKDMEKWFHFLIIFDSQFLAGLQLSPVVDCCVTLLQHSEILSDPVTQTRVVSILSGFIESDKRSRRNVVATGWGSGAAGNLSAIVHGSPKVKEHLGPALLHTYVAVDTAEGVDVDKEDFEKYGARSNIMSLLKALWQRGDCRESILKSCGTVTFQAFLHALLDMLSYFLNESLCRLMDVGKFEKLKHSAQWDPLPSKQKKLKEKFYDMDKRWARGCNIHGAKLLEFFTSWTDEAPVVLDLCRPPLSGQAAASICEFLESLCGPQASQLKVLNMDSYHFNPPAMLKDLCLILSRLWAAERGTAPVGGFFHSMAAYPDYSHKAITKAVSVISSHNLLPRATVDDLSAMASKLEVLSRRLGTFVEVDEDDSWCDAVEQLSVNSESLLRDYVTALDALKYDGTELVETHSYAAKALNTDPAPNSPKVKAILAELGKLQNLLQVHLDSSIFIRQDEDHLDLVRAIITGPKDTPYSRGCFVFDVYFPERYPNVSPLVKIVTTGNSTVRFNPNLYRDGKVCLSLLGTFHGGDATEKWNPKTSSMYQVLISIQGLIMNAEPMYNEPGYSDLQGTPEGNDRSAEYNARLHPSTVRYAMLEQLRNPPLGFEEVIQDHFRIQKPLILQQCARWLKDSPTPQLKKRLRKAVAELRKELEKL